MNCIQFFIPRTLPSYRVKRSIWHQSKYVYWWLATDRWLADLSLWKISHDHIIRSTLCLVLKQGFWGCLTKQRYFQESKMVAGGHFEHFKCPYFCNMSPDPLHACTATTLCSQTLLDNCCCRRLETSFMVKRKERASSFGGTDEKIMQQEYTLDWSV